MIITHSLRMSQAEALYFMSSVQRSLGKHSNLSQKLYHVKEVQHQGSNLSN